MNERKTGMIGQMTLMGAVLLIASASYGQQEAKSSPNTAPAQAQAAIEGSQDERNFELIFTAREMDENGKVVNSRHFDTTVTTGSPKGGGTGNIRSGVKVPVVTSSNPGASMQQFTYVDVGANFDVNHARVVKGNRLAMQVSAEISGADTAAGDSSKMPIRQNRWMGDVEIPIGGRKVIFSSDDLSSKKTLQIELAVVPVER